MPFTVSCIIFLTIFTCFPRRSIFSNKRFNFNSLVLFYTFESISFADNDYKLKQSQIQFDFNLQYSKIIREKNSFHDKKLKFSDTIKYQIQSQILRPRFIPFAASCLFLC